ncbi:GntR family transcriptional regulator [Roseibium sp.]|uniref:GntR family transcriptional regulator n=1 Tax=Roseibium sp. TaxID=1936156 RepID=UPI003B52A3BB
MSQAPLKRGDRAQDIENKIREGIISGTYAPGSALRQEELAQQFEASRMPIREALRALSVEGLVQLVPNKGAVVAPISAAELRENFEMREAAETLAIRLSVPHLSNVQIDKAAQIERDIKGAGIAEYGALNKAFHCTLYAPAQRPRLLAHIQSLHDLAERYLRFTLKYFDYQPKSAEEHDAILQACYQRDAKEAERLTSKHITEAGSILEEYLANH